MEYHIREATASDDETRCPLYAEGDSWHHDALPEVFGPPAAPAWSRAYVAERMSDDAVLFVADANGAVVGLVDVYVYDGPDHPPAHGQYHDNHRGSRLPPAFDQVSCACAHPAGVCRPPAGGPERGAPARAVRCGPDT